MQELPTLDGSGHVAICPICSDVPDEGSSGEPADVESPMGNRFKDLIQEPEFLGFDELPDDLVDDLPEETKGLLVDRLTHPPDTPTEELPRNVTDSLRDRGYVISEDARGFRISGMPYTGRGDTAELTPGEVVRMAAELEGGTGDISELQDCPNCQAKSPSAADTCQWCGHPLDSTSDASTDPDLVSDSTPEDATE
jgi:hypothetical protein